jgi:predicted aldo/keto reductase-like oxidoreductase
VLRYALERGINLLDTAQLYRTYPYIRAALKGTNFDPVIVSKCFGGSYEEMRLAVEEARRETDRDVIDIFLLHEVRHGPDWDLRRGAWACLREAKAQGLVRAIGVSTHHVDVAERVASDPEVDVLFPLINFKGLGIRRGEAAGSREEMAAAIEKAEKAGIGVFVMKVFGGGNLVADYLTALDYVFGLPGIAAAMIGLGYRHEIDRIVEYAEGVINRDYVPDVTNKRIQIDQGDCEGCGACVKKCPNRAIFLNCRGFAEVNHAICLTCGYCAPVCPVRAILLF